MCDPSSCTVRADLFQVTHPGSVSGQHESSYDRMESALLLVQVLQFFLYVYGLFAFMFMCSTCWPGACRGQKRMLDPRSCLWLSALCGCLFLPLWEQQLLRPLSTPSVHCRCCSLSPVFSPHVSSLPSSLSLFKTQSHYIALMVLEVTVRPG